jgi:hypothetical protein
MVSVFINCAQGMDLEEAPPIKKQPLQKTTKTNKKKNQTKNKNKPKTNKNKKQN